VLTRGAYFLILMFVLGTHKGCQKLKALAIFGRPQELLLHEKYHFLILNSGKFIGLLDQPYSSKTEFGILITSWFLKIEEVIYGPRNFYWEWKIPLYIG